MNKDRYVLIMAGGVGSRFWPKSRNHFPKQFIDILGTGKSLLQLTNERFLKLCPSENIFVLTNEAYADLVSEQLPNILKDNILLEPSRNNTAPCIAYAAYKILKKNENANIVVAPSDHLILKEDVFIDKINKALDFTEKYDALLTLGITPNRPDTGYGYINYKNDGSAEIFKVNSFKEKPELKVAEDYLASGDYLWNAGIFIWKAANLKRAFERYSPEINELFIKGTDFYNTPNEKKFISINYPTSPNISIDYAILEKADNIYTIPAEIGWSDLGTWASLHAVADKDDQNNVLNCNQVDLQDTANCIINLPTGKAAVIRGLENFIVVDDEQVLLIYPKSEEQEIKKVAQKMATEFGEKYS